MIQLSTQLTQREREVLALIAQGLQHDEVADVLIVSPYTISTHVRHIRMKLGAHNCVHALFLAMTDPTNSTQTG